VAEASSQTDAQISAAVEVSIWNPTDESRQFLKLTDRRALPLQVGDHIRVVGRSRPAAYLYLVWIDTEGKALPLYPWEPGNWQRLPGVSSDGPAETPAAFVDLPAGADGWPMKGTPGTNTLLLLVRKQPLSNETDLKKSFDAMPPQPEQIPLTTLSLRNGELDVHRGGPDLAAPATSDNPAQRLAGLIREQLGGQFEVIEAVCFSFAGE
jgi:hypothetical protein